MTPDFRPVDLATGFRTADPAFSPVPLWWWSGDEVTAGRLRWQIDRFIEGGVWNAVIMNLAPTGPLYGNPADQPAFMSDAWWNLVRETCAHAQRTGFRLWFYDQIGFSGANIQGQLIANNRTFAARTLERVVIEVDGSGEIACPSGGEPLLATANPFDEGDPVRLEIVNGIAQWSGPDPARLALTYTTERGFDYFNPSACAALIDAIHGEFERHVGDYIGDVIVGSFQDELPPLPLWGTTFAATFAKLHGYDPVPHLDALWEDSGESGRRFRHDYHATRAHLAEAAFFEPLFEWHDARNLIVGVDQQNPARTGDPEGGVRLYADYLKTHRWFSAPGSDHHGEAKVHSSLAHLYDRPRTWIESFHSSGWGGTLEETFDWLVPWLRAGANLYDPHASYYSTRGGWFEWAPPSTDWRQPYWRHYKVFADAVARLCWLLTQGRHASDVAVLYPTTTIQSGVGVGEHVSSGANAAHKAYQALVGAMIWFEQETGLLDSVGIDYDVIDDDSMIRGEIEGDRLRVGSEAWRTIILPACDVLLPEIAHKLIAFAEAGGSVIAIDIAPTRLSGEQDGALLQRLDEVVRIVDCDALGLALREHQALVEAPVPTLVRQLDDATIVFVPGAFPGASDISGLWVTQIDFDRSTYPDSMTIAVRGVQGVPSLWDPFTGTSHAIDPAQCREGEGSVTVDIPFDGAPCAVLVWSDDPAGLVAQDTATNRVIATLPDVWDVELEPTLDNRWGDFAMPATSGPMPIEQWTLRDGNDEPVHVTFEPRARWQGSDGEWHVSSWSTSRGIHKDNLHRRSLGPSGQVPEEFIEFGTIAIGESVVVETAVDLVEPFEGWLAIGAGASKRIWLDDAELPIDPTENSRYQTLAPISLTSGTHHLRLILTSTFAGTLRASWALVTEPESFRRPEYLTNGDARVPESAVTFATEFDIPASVADATLLVSTRGPATIALDGEIVGRQGGYLPYGDGSAAHHYSLADRLFPGRHILAIAIDDSGREPIRVALDGEVTFANGSSPLWIMTSPEWTVSRDGQPVPLMCDGAFPNDPAIVQVRPRPHPLPDARWLAGDAADPGTVLRTAWYVPGTVPPDETFRTVVPPGASRAHIPTQVDVSARIDGEIATVTRSGRDQVIDLPHPDAIDRVLEITSATTPGATGGGAFTGPIRYESKPGRMPLGNWEEHGLSDYSGIVHYRTSLTMPRIEHGRLVLDLGDLRGSARLTVNNRDCGTRIVAPFRYDITEAASGRERLEIDIELANTLGPYLDAISPTSFVQAGQTVSGLFGPVRLLGQ